MSYQLAQYLLEQRKSSFISDIPPGQFQPPAVLQRVLHTSALSSVACRASVLSASALVDMVFLFSVQLRRTGWFSHYLFLDILALYLSPKKKKKKSYICTSSDVQIRWQQCTKAYSIGLGLTFLIQIFACEVPHSLYSHLEVRKALSKIVHEANCSQMSSVQPFFILS